MLRTMLTFALTFLLGAQLRAEEPEAPITPDSEMAAATAFQTAGEFPVADRQYLRFFTTFAVPEKYKTRKGEVNLRTQCEQSLAFVVNHCMSVRSVGAIVRPYRVPGSRTLWYVDIRDYGWSTEEIDSVFKFQPYFLAPLVEGRNNVILYRADWFVVYATDNTKLADRGVNEFPYYTLLYGINKAPKDAAEFQKFWRVDIETIRKEKVETGTIVDAGDSGVSQHTRQLRKGRTIFGYYYETRDIKSHDFDPDKIQSRDFLEDLFAKQFDAGEYIASHKNGLQVYLLTAGVNDKFKRVEFGDPTVVIDRQDGHDPRVRTSKGCIVCHANGIIPFTNAVRDLFRLGVDLRVKDKDLQREIRAFYLKNDGSEIEDDNKIFERAVRQCNGLDPFENMKAFVNVYDWYCDKVTLDQAAVECGLTTPDYQRVLKVATSGRLSQLFHGRSIPRDVWDSVNVGGYVQSMLLYKRVDAKQLQPAQAPKPEQAKKEEIAPVQEVVVTVDKAPIYRNGAITVYFSKGVRATVVREETDWWQVRHEQWEGFIRKTDASPVR